ncbi:MAG: hypothetical protein FJ147_14980 [Deltaproteobacteria bacterium]|nr:hypothetical protein [Deltaproteobacteria bacterium]
MSQHDITFAVIGFHIGCHTASILINGAVWVSAVGRDKAAGRSRRALAGNAALIPAYIDG